MIDLDAAIAAVDTEVALGSSQIVSAMSVAAAAAASAVVAADATTGTSAARASHGSSHHTDCIDIVAVLDNNDKDDSSAVGQTLTRPPRATAAPATTAATAAGAAIAAAAGVGGCSAAASSSGLLSHHSGAGAGKGCNKDGEGKVKKEKKKKVNLDSMPVDLELEGDDDDECVTVEASQIVDGGVCMVVDSDSESSSSSSSTRSRSPRATRTALGGAAAAAALITTAAPLDLEVEDVIISRTLIFPTEDALQLQHEGQLVQLMAETGATLSVSPGEDDDMSIASVRCDGTASAVGKALWELEQLHKALIEKKVMVQADAFMADMNKMVELEIPVKHLSAVVGSNGSDLQAIRKRCGGIMIAIKPPDAAGGAYVVCLGPGDGDNVERALEELKDRLRKATATAATATGAA